MGARALTAAVLALSALTATARGAADFPEITDQDRALREVPGEPGAAAVFIYKNGYFKMLSPERNEPSSRLTVLVRIKILTEAGKSQGEVSIPHSEQVRLQNFRGRTVLPDGRVVPLPADATFRRKQSEAYRRYVTSVAFPAVEPGAILDYRYDLFFDSIYFFEPWYFSEEVPVLHSEIVYQVPPEIRTIPSARDPLGAGFQSQRSRNAMGDDVLKIWSEDLPSVPIEPYGLPFSTLATQFMLLPVTYATDISVPLLETWPGVCKDFEDRYKEVRRKGGNATKRALELAKTAAGPRAKTAALYAFVRDRIETNDVEGVFLSRDTTVDNVLARGSGDYVEKALLLQAMLKAVGIESRPVWVALHSRGPIDQRIANPGWFQRVLVAVELDRQTVWLDPSDPSLGFGKISSEVEGMPALVLNPKGPEFVTLPASSFEGNGRRATVKLEVDDKGHVSGTGEMLLTGHHARRRMDPLADEGKRTEAWLARLGQSYADFRVDAVRVEESREAGEVRLSWSMTQREDAVLGDEVSLLPSRPVGPATQPFVLPATRRRSPVFFESPYRQEVELQLRWAPGWKLEAAPPAASHECSGGALTTSVQVEPGGQSLVYRRRFDVRQMEFLQLDEYEMMRTLFAETERNDARAVVLVRR